mgnify:CR=1 FL=1
MAMNRKTGHRMAETTAPVSGRQPAGADAVQSRDVQLHHLDVGRHRPGTTLDGPPIGSSGIAHPQRDGGDV